MKLLVRHKGIKQPLSDEVLRKYSSLVLKTVKGGAFEKKTELSLVLTNDREMKTLNKAYRNKDETTDVLSFPLLEGKKMKSGLKEAIPLGDVVISLPQTRRQAANQGKKFNEELALLLTHGILHLLGYDHVTKAQEKRMFGLQKRLLKKWKT